MSPLEQALGILGEHYRNFVVVVQFDEHPSSYDLQYSDPYAAIGLLQQSFNTTRCLWMDVM